jgi:hypothetical protein
MALNILMESGRSVEWHVGESNPIEWDKTVFVETVQADGHELEHIKALFGPTLPTAKGRVVRWFGDDAKTIVGNLTNLK